MRSISIDLTPLMIKMLEEIISSRLYGTAVIQRARCILLAFRKKKFWEISQIVNLSAKAVSRWFRRFADSIEALQYTEKLGVKAALRRAILDCLRDAPRSGAPKKFTPAEVASVISIACEDPEKSQRPVTSWTCQEIAEEAILRGVVDSISDSQVQRFLHQVHLSPHKKKGWCFTTEKDQELFQQQAEIVCQTYLNAPLLFTEQRVHTICVDEMTSLQANEKRAPGKRPAPGQCGKEECQYTRHGTVCLTGNWDVVAGRFVNPTIEETRNNEDFAKHIDRLINTDLEDGWVFVVDNLNTHCGEDLVRVVARHLGIPSEELGRVGKHGILKSMASRRAFLSDVSHRIRFVYIPKHSSWLNQVEVIFGMFNRRVMRGGNFTSKADLIAKLKRFTDYFNAHIAKPMNWTFTGRPTEKESFEAPKTWRQLWPFRHLLATIDQPDRT